MYSQRVFGVAPSEIPEMDYITQSTVSGYKVRYYSF